MGLFDRAKELADQHADKVEGAIEKVADVVDEKTGGKYSDKIDQGAEAAKGYIGGDADGAVGDEGEGQQEPPSRLTP